MTEQGKDYKNLKNTLKFIFYSAIGIIMFFVPITIHEKTTIPLDHIVKFILKNFHGAAGVYALILIVVGAIIPFVNKTWNKDTTATVFSIFKVLGAIVGIMVYFKIGPEWMMHPDFGPFLFNSLGVKVGLIVPVGAVFLSFIVGYGLMEFIGVLMRPVMVPIWKTPGRSAVDAVASFVGSYSIGLLITNQVYKDRKYTAKESCIIATGFSTVSATFMVVVANTLGIMDIWNVFFWGALVVTFIVTAITVRIWPLRNKPDTYYGDQEGFPEESMEGNIFANALDEGLKAAQNPTPLHRIVIDNIRDGVKIVMGFLPNVMSIGLLGLVLAEFTPVFDYVGYIFYPFTLLAKVPEPLLAAKASSVGLAEMFLPALLAAGAPLVTKFVVAVVSISSILFFSATIPCILSTEIPITLKEIVIIWLERTILTILIAAPLAHFIL